MCVVAERGMCGRSGTSERVRFRGDVMGRVGMVITEMV
jgi:hypothetical protein